MARNSSGAWFRQSKDTWYATVDGLKTNLKVKGKHNAKLAQLAWHKLMAGGLPSQPIPEPIVAAPKALKVNELITLYLESKCGTVKPTTHATYGTLLRKVSARFGNEVAERLKATDMMRWLNLLPVSKSTKCDIAGCLSLTFKFGEREGLVRENPIKNMKRPACESRGIKAIITPEVHEKILSAASPALRTLLIFLHETGARPNEASRIAGKDVDWESGVVILTEHKTDHTGKPRLIVLSHVALELLRHQLTTYPTGYLMRNMIGTAWTKDSIANAMRDASLKAGVKAIAYGYRHTYATDCLVRGIPDATVAALLGHSSTIQLHKHYSHIGSSIDVLKAGLAKVRG